MNTKYLSKKLWGTKMGKNEIQIHIGQLKKFLTGQKNENKQLEASLQVWTVWKHQFQSAMFQAESPCYKYSGNKLEKIFS